MEIIGQLKYSFFPRLTQLSLITPKSFRKKFRQIGMKLYAVVLIVFAILALSAICKAGKGKDNKPKPINVSEKDFLKTVSELVVADEVKAAIKAREEAASGGESSKMNARPPNQTESCGSNNTAPKRSSFADDASSSPSSTNPPSKKPKSGKKN
uniref:Uncharacterized protein n=1 Tax=Globodera pallida TaxID=36090 RepID=A0A183CJI7_GLOPA